MAEFCLVASHGYLPGLVFYPDQSLCRPSKEYQPILPSLRSKQDMLKLCSLYAETYQIEEAWKPIGGLSEGAQFIKIDQATRRHVLNGMQALSFPFAADNHQRSILLSFGIARQIMRREKILKFLASGLSLMERGGVDMSVLYDFMGLQALATNVPQEPFVPEQRWCSYDAESQPSLVYPSAELCFQKALLDLTNNIAHESEVACEPDGQLAFTGTGTEMKDVLPIIAEFYSSKGLMSSEKHSLLVPYFDRRRKGAARAGVRGSALKLEIMTVPPVQSPDKIKAKQSLKKRNKKKADRERDMYTNNYVLACESLLSIMIDRKQHGKTAVQSLKKSGPELPRLLTQFSASIAGTGIAVLFCVIYKVACSSAPLCASKILSTGLGLGLVWFSWAVNRLRDTILYISKRSSKSDNLEEDMVKTLDRNVNEIYFRAATLLAVVVLRLA